MTFWSSFWLWKYHSDFYVDLIYFVVFGISKMSLRWKQMSMDKPEFPDTPPPQKKVIFHSRTWYWHGFCDLGILEQGKDSEGKQWLKELNKYRAWICLKHIWNTLYWFLESPQRLQGQEDADLWQANSVECPDQKWEGIYNVSDSFAELSLGSYSTLYAMLKASYRASCFPLVSKFCEWRSSCQPVTKMGILLAVPYYGLPSSLY